MPGVPNARGTCRAGANARTRRPCIGLAGATGRKGRSRGATMLVLPADHVIRDAAGLSTRGAAGGGVVDEDPSRLLTFGTPLPRTRPRVLVISNGARGSSRASARDRTRPIAWRSFARSLAPKSRSNIWRPAITTGTRASSYGARATILDAPGPTAIAGDDDAHLEAIAPARKLRSAGIRRGLCARVRHDRRHLDRFRRDGTCR